MAKYTKKKGHLGRGLDAILPSNLEANAPQISQGAEIGRIPIRLIKEINPYQPRTEFDQEALEDLADSVKRHGIIQPITVRKLGEQEYQLIAGERRLRASKLAGLQEIPAFVRTADDAQMLEMALIENVKREDLNPIEIALSYQRLVSELNLKQEELGTRVDKKRSTITNYLRLLKLPDDIQVGLRQGEISMGHARALISVDDPIKQLELYHLVIDKGLSVRQTEKFCRQWKEAAKASQKPKPAPQTVNDLHLKKVREKLEEKLGNKIRINQKSDGNGEISIPFSSNQDLNRILEIMEIL